MYNDMFNMNNQYPLAQGVGNSFPVSSYPSANMQGMQSAQQMQPMGLGNFPMPMSRGPLNPTPPLYPTMSPQTSWPPMPYPNSNMQQKQFAKGGSVRSGARRANNLQDISLALSQLGQRNDSLLAHINPEEAQFLEQNFGGDINPVTGLPQYGLEDERAAMAKAEAFYKNYEPLFDLAYERNYFGAPGSRGASAPASNLSASAAPFVPASTQGAPSVAHPLAQRQGIAFPATPSRNTNADTAAGYTASGNPPSNAPGFPPPAVTPPGQLPYMPARFRGQYEHYYDPNYVRGKQYRYGPDEEADPVHLARLVGYIHGHKAGGPIKAEQDIPSLAGYLSTLGVGDDKILAHINPNEAALLQQRFGGDINPETGLPQYGLFKGLGKVFKKALPIIGTAVGTYFGGPVGGTIGGAIGGGIGGGKKGALMGAGMGALNSYLGPSIGNAFGVNPTGVMGKSLNMGGEGLLGSLGLGNVLGNKPLTGMMPNGGAATLAGKAAESVAKGGEAGGLGGMLSSLLGGKGGLQDAATLAVIAGMLGGKDKGKFKKVGPYGEPYEKPYEPPASEWAGRSYQYPQMAQAEGTPELANYRYNKPRTVKKGGYISGDTDGQADKVKALLSDGEFVIPADVVSDLGNGNNNAGGKSLAAFIGNVRKHKHKSVKGLPPKAKPIGEYLGRARNA